MAAQWCPPPSTRQVSRHWKRAVGAVGSPPPPPAATAPTMPMPTAGRGRRARGVRRQPRHPPATEVRGRRHAPPPPPRRRRRHDRRWACGAARRTATGWPSAGGPDAAREVVAATVGAAAAGTGLGSVDATSGCPPPGLMSRTALGGAASRCPRTAENHSCLVVDVRPATAAAGADGAGGKRPPAPCGRCAHGATIEGRAAAGSAWGGLVESSGQVQRVGERRSRWAKQCSGQARKQVLVAGAVGQGHSSPKAAREEETSKNTPTSWFNDGVLCSAAVVARCR